MQAYKSWKNRFTKKHLREIFNEKIAQSTSIGLDQVSAQNFGECLDENLEIILRKSYNMSYNFTRYKLLLFSKGPDKKPRQICIPTIRDKLVSAVVNEILTDVYKSKNLTPLPQIIINDIIQNYKLFNFYIRLDIKAFYSSIKHEKLNRILKRCIRKKELFHLISNAIQTGALYSPSQKSIERIKGIPEGLSISNSLANIFLLKIDEKYNSMKNVKYYRYVDDILILTQKDNFKNIENEIRDDLEELDLEVNNDKFYSGPITNKFEYLGYQFACGKVCVRESSILKIEQSIEDLFKRIRVNNFHYIEWKINIKITGFIWNQHKYGWLFFYSQITDMEVLFHLDNLIQKFCKKCHFNKNSSMVLKLKRFVRAYMEIKNALHKTKYIPNIDEFTLENKKEILKNIIDLNNKSDRSIEFEFSKIMKKEIRDIERDIQHFS